MMGLSDLGRGYHLRNEQGGTNTIKENICSENSQTTATARHHGRAPQKKT